MPQIAINPMITITINVKTAEGRAMKFCKYAAAPIETAAAETTPEAITIKPTIKDSALLLNPLFT